MSLGTMWIQTQSLLEPQHMQGPAWDLLLWGLTGHFPVSKKNAAQPLLRPREKSVSQSCSLAPSTGKPTATTTKTEDRFTPLEGANFARKPPPLMQAVAPRGAAGAVVLCAVPWAGFCAARTFQPFSRALLAQQHQCAVNICLPKSRHSVCCLKLGFTDTNYCPTLPSPVLPSPCLLQRWDHCSL